ncbi:hypothetical protein ACS0TY_027583 [Phlomoides rotata]
MPSLLEKINGWNSTDVSRDGSGSQLSVVMNVHLDADTSVDHFYELEDERLCVEKDSARPVAQLSEKLQKQTISTKEGSSQGVL